MLSFTIAIMALMIVLASAFIHATNRTLYQNTWQQLQTYSDSLVEDAIRYDMSDRSFEGFANESLAANAALLSDQKIHFAIFDMSKKQTFINSGYTPSISSSQWKRLKKGETIYLKIANPRIKANRKNGTGMTEVLRPYFYHHKLIAVVSIGTFLSVIQENLRQTTINLLLSLIIGCVVTIILSYFLAHAVTNRIERLRKATKQVAEGNYDVHVPVHCNDEIDDLSRSFNQMTVSLRESEQEIRRQEERRRQFMADAAHEMRTPLTTINGILEGLQYDAIPEEDKKHSIELMRNDTQRLIRLVNDNLDYEKIRTNQIAMERKVFDAAAALHNLIDQLQKKAQAQNDQLHLAVPPTLRVYVDYDRFIQIMFNLIQNAIQFTTHGTIQVSGRHLAKGSQFVVQDNGIGMTKDQVANIWDRFYKADPSRANTKGESGLGLAIVHQLVQLHGGSIEVKSTLHEGTTFTVYFPDRDYAPHLKADQGWFHNYTNILYSAFYY